MKTYLPVEIVGFVLLSMMAGFWAERIAVQLSMHEAPLMRPTRIEMKAESTIIPSIEISTPRWRLPEGFHLIPHRHYTHEVGTSLHPTLDGGIINATELISFDDEGAALPIEFQSRVKPNEQTSELYNKLKNPGAMKIKQAQFLSAKRVDPFSDPLKLEHFLKEAATQGKLAYVLNQSKTLGLPATVAFVPMVESRYHNEAFSSKGALGAWQLMPKTAQAWGLSPKQRTNFKAETNVALLFLQQLHDEFGDWRWAYAAYNAGPTRVRRALEQNPNAHSIEDLDVPLETKHYVEQLESLQQGLTHVGAL